MGASARVGAGGVRLRGMCCWERAGRDWLTIFGVVFPLSFILTPLCGYLQDRCSLSVVLAFVNACFVVWQTTAVLPSLYAQMVTIVVSSAARQFLFSFFFASGPRPSSIPAPPPSALAPVPALSSAPLAVVAREASLTRVLRRRQWGACSGTATSGS